LKIPLQRYCQRTSEAVHTANICCCMIIQNNHTEKKNAIGEKTAVKKASDSNNVDMFAYNAFTGDSLASCQQ